jgi:hypothetical protein
LTEIPEHLLKRSKAAKAAKTGEDAGAGDAAAADSGAEAGAAPVAAAAAAPAVAPESLPNLDPVPEPPTPEPHYVTASKARKRIPVWALPVVAALPVWALTYAGTMQQPEQEDPVLTESAALYSTAGCAGCHGGTGGGGTGYALAGGEVLTTFPSPIDQMVHVARGSAAIQGETYGADGRRVAGQLGEMPAQAGQLSQVELELVVFHERATLSGEDTSGAGYQEWIEHMREAAESGDATEINLELLLACADPAVTPGATGAGAPDGEECPGPPAEGGEEAALGG